MNLTFEQLPQHLTKHLAPIYFISGDEFLLVQEACDLIRDAARKRGIEERIRFDVRKGFVWDDFLLASKNQSLFSVSKLVIMRFESSKQDAKGTSIIEEYIENPSLDDILLIIAPKMDSSWQKLRWVKQIAAKHVFLKIWPVDVKYLPSWIARRFKKNGLNASVDACKLLAERAEGNLFYASWEIEKILLLYGPGNIEAEQILDAVADNSRYNIFALKDSALIGDAKKVVHIIDSLKAEDTEPILVLWALAKELRVLLKVSYAKKNGNDLENIFEKEKIFQQQVPFINRALARHSLLDLRAMVAFSAAIDRKIKGVEVGDVWQDLATLALRLAGKNIFVKTC